jgi:hypothetical protein
MMTRCSAASRVPFGGYAALDTASAPRRIGFYRRLLREVISTTFLNGSIPVRITFSNFARVARFAARVRRHSANAALRRRDPTPPRVCGHRRMCGSPRATRGLDIPPAVSHSPLIIRWEQMTAPNFSAAASTC